MDKYPDYSTYQTLCARYLQRSPEEFFAKTDVKGREVLDLCCGGGLIAELALSKGAQCVTMIDMSKQMLNPALLKRARVVFYESDVAQYVNGYWVNNDDPFHVITCRQGVEYWLPDVDHITKLARYIQDGGMFVFNSYGNKPPTEPRLKQYQINGLDYTEVAYTVGDVVHNIVTATGYQPHFTSFKWMSKDEIAAKLTPAFVVEPPVGNSTMWYCWKKP